MIKMNYPTLETERLVLRELTLEDRELLFRHFSDEEVTRFMDIEPCKDLDEAEELIRDHVESTGTRWGLFDKATGEMVGTCGYHCWVQEEARAEIGYDLCKAAWGQGLMREALLSVLEFGYAEMKLEKIEATCAVQNERSNNVLMRLGFEQAEELVDGLLYFSLRKDRYLAGS